MKRRQIRPLPWLHAEAALPAPPRLLHQPEGPELALERTRIGLPRAAPGEGDGDFDGARGGGQVPILVPISTGDDGRKTSRSVEPYR